MNQVRMSSNAFRCISDDINTIIETLLFGNNDYIYDVNA
jgi:hypothetical protein